MKLFLKLDLVTGNTIAIPVIDIAMITKEDSERVIVGKTTVAVTLKSGQRFEVKNQFEELVNELNYEELF